jgi:hypothetical protein
MAPLENDLLVLAELDGRVDDARSRLERMVQLVEQARLSGMTSPVAGDVLLTMHESLRILVMHRRRVMRRIEAKRGAVSTASCSGAVPDLDQD